MLSRVPVSKPSRNLPKEQIFTVNQLKSFMSDFNANSLKTDLPVSECTYKQIKTHTGRDPVMKQVQHLILTGWPQKNKLPGTNCLKEVQPYYSYRDELVVLDGIIYKGPRLVVPMSMRLDILKKLHTSHQGTAATIHRARNTVF